MSKQTYMKEDRKNEMKKGEDGVYKIISREHNLGYDSDLRLRTENLKGGLVDLTC